jgi:serine/threonine protein kinase/Tol biopolymer transport system component
LAEACGDDRTLRDEVASLLSEEDDASSFLETPLGGVAATPPLIGQRLGAYRLEGLIGAGGMGEVYQAKDVRLDRDVAIKILPPHWSGHPERRTRFEREARAVAALKHPNICTIHDVGRDEGIDFLVMELIEGESLAARLSRGPMPCAEAIGRAIEIADALDKAHRHGIIHRDLKPGNVMLARMTGRGRATQAKLLDFSIARISPSRTSVPLAIASDASVTEGSGPLGTVEYMAPEQVEGLQTDARTDIFAFGALLYEMLTAQVAFARATKAETLTAVLREQPDERAFAKSGVEPSIIRIIRRCLEKDPADRFQTAHDLTFALENAPSSWSAPDVTDRTIIQAPRRSLLKAVSMLATVVAMVALGIWLLAGAPRNTTPRDATPFMWQLPEGITLGSNPAVSPDGRRVVFVGVGDSGSRLFVRDLISLEATPIPGTAGAKQPFWSPDGDAVGFFANGRLMKTALQGPAPVDLAAAPDARGGTWSRSGVIVFQPFFRDRGLARISADGGEVQAATQLDVTGSDTIHKWPVFLPDGEHFLYLVLSVDESRRGIYVGSLSERPSRAISRLFPTASGVQYVVPENHDAGFLLSITEGQIEARPFDANHRMLTGDPRSIGVAVGETTLHYPPMIGVSAGLLAFARVSPSAGYHFASIDADGKNLTIRPDRELVGPARVSPYGDRMARTIASTVSGDADIWVDDLVRGTHSRITTSRDLDLSPVWSPDGRQIAYRSGPFGTSHLSIASADGTGVLKVTPCPGEPCLPTDWSPDGRWLVVNVRGDIWSVPINEKELPHPLVQGPYMELDARVSPDGRWISYVSDESGRTEVYARSLTGSSPRVLISRGGDQPVWGRDGRELFYVSLANELHRAPVRYDPTGHPIVDMAVRLPLPPFGVRHIGITYDMSPDTRRIYFPHPGDPLKPQEIGFVLNWAARLK